MTHSAITASRLSVASHLRYRLRPNRLAAVLALACASGTPVAMAGTVTGPGSSVTIDTNSPVELWRATDGATLYVIPGGQTLSLSANAATLNLDGARVSPSPFSNAITLSAGSLGTLNNSTVTGAISTSNRSYLQLSNSQVNDGTPAAFAIQVTNSTADITGSQVVSTSSRALGLVQVVGPTGIGLPPSVVRASGSSFSGTGIGVSTAGSASLTLAGSTVTATNDGFTGAFGGGIGLGHYGGTITVSQGSQVSGARDGAYMAADNGTVSNPQGPLGTLVVDGSHLEGQAGAAIVVDSLRTGVTDATIQIRNGATLRGGNGNLLEVRGSNNTADFHVDNSQLVGNISHAGGNTVNVALTNQASLTGQLTNVSTLSMDRSRWTVTGDSDVGSLAMGNGTIAYQAPAGGNYKTLTVHGDFSSNGGLLLMNTELGDDRAGSDRLHVQGNTAGNAFVQVNNVGGIGAETANGIQLIQVDGASNADFKLSGRAVAGKYEYFLFKGGRADPNDGSWYLRSEFGGAGPDPDPTPNPDVPPENCLHVVGGCLPPPPGAEPLLRPEPAAYLANQAASVGMFQHTMYDRLGDPGLDPQGHGTWARAGLNQADYGASGQELAVKTDSSVLQVGTDLFTWGQSSRARVGVMLGTGYASSQVSSTVTGYAAKGRVQGKAAGVYGTWLQDPRGAVGAYVDTWAQFGSYTNRVDGDGLAEERYSSRTWAGSLEAGYAFHLFQTEGAIVYVQPQAQVTYTDYSAGDHTETNGTRVTTDRAGGMATRVGVRIYGHALTGGNIVQPFVALNWLRGGDDVMRFDGERESTEAPRGRYEVKAGLQAQLGRRWTGWGNVAVQRGSNDYRSGSVQVGMKYVW